MVASSRSAVSAFGTGPASAHDARRFVRQVLQSMGVAGTVIDRSELVTSELVTNAILHAAASPTVSVHVHDEAIRIDVQDGSPMLPVLRNYDDDATTGRGLNLVSSTVDDWGVELSGLGKTVWVVLGRAAAPQRTPSPQDRRSGPAEDGATTNEPTDPSITGTSAAVAPRSSTEDVWPIAFLAVPVDVYQQLEQYNESLLRECELLAIQLSTTPPREGERERRELVGLVTDARPYFLADMNEFRATVQQALVDGHHTVDLHWTADRNRLAWTKRFLCMCDHADRLSQEGLLLTAPAATEVVLLRRWFVAQVEAQMTRNERPSSFPVEHRIA